MWAPETSSAAFPMEQTLFCDREEELTTEITEPTEKT